jgi:hypothetical protein
MSASCPDYDALKALSEELGRPVKTLIALSPQNDPFFAGLPASRAAAEWFAISGNATAQRTRATSVASTTSCRRSRTAPS